MMGKKYHYNAQSNFKYTILTHVCQILCISTIGGHVSHLVATQLKINESQLTFISAYKHSRDMKNYNAQESIEMCLEVLLEWQYLMAFQSWHAGVKLIKVSLYGKVSLW